MGASRRPGKVEGWAGVVVRVGFLVRRHLFGKLQMFMFMLCEF